METFFQKRKSPAYMMWLSYLSFYILSGFAFLMWNIVIISIAVSLLTFFVITLNYESPMLKRILVTPTILLLLLVIVEHLGMLVYIQSEFAFTQPMGLAEYAFTQFIATGVIAYVFTFSLKKLLVNIKKDSLKSPLYLASYLVIAIISFAISILIVNHPSLSLFAIAAMIVALTAINVLALFFLDRLSIAFEKRLEAAIHAQEKEYYFAQSQLMQESVKKVRSIRHDMNLHLSTLKDFSTDNKEATEYINSLLSDISESEVYSTTGNIAVDSIINFKLKNAKEDNIKLDLSLFVPPVLNIEIVDIVIILGNLLDNALDAVAKVEDKKIRLDIEFSKGNLYIKIDNTFDGNIKYTGEKNGKEEHITTLKSGDEHGHGLDNIRKSVEKYNGHIDIAHDDNVFSVGVLLYVDGIMR